MRRGRVETRLIAQGTSSPSSGRGFIAAVIVGADTVRRTRVVPVVRTGLHCGKDGVATIAKADLSSPSSGRGFIAATDMRPSSCVKNPVVPVVRTGLHCGFPKGVPMATPRLVVPVVRTGLHCGLGEEGE